MRISGRRYVIDSPQRTSNLPKGNDAMTITLGDRIKDRLTGFSGICSGITEFLYGCRKLHVQPETLGKDGRIQDPEYIDEPRIELLRKKNFLQAAPRPPQKVGAGEVVELGDRVEDTLTGLTGVAAGIGTPLYGCRRIHIEPEKINPDGKLHDIIMVDEPRVKILKKKNFLETAPRAPNAPPGGPRESNKSGAFGRR